MTKLAVSVQEGADMIGVSRAYLYRLFGQGVLTPRKVGRKSLLMVSDLEGYLASLPKAEVRNHG